MGNFLKRGLTDDVESSVDLFGRDGMGLVEHVAKTTLLMKLIKFYLEIKFFFSLHTPANSPVFSIL